MIVRVELASEVLGDALRLIELVELACRRNRPRMRATGASLVFGHVRDDRRRVDAAREERAERHFADEPHADRFGQQCVELLEIALLVGDIASRR